jgi:REP element-mobilizing transposase RayT
MHVPRNVYSEIHLHITWHTKDNVPVLADEIEHQLHRYLKHRALETQGVVVHAVNGVADHVHLAVTVPPTLPISEWIGEMKGASAYFVNHQIANRRVLEWQTGYGIVSFGTKNLPWVVKYIENQKEHHAKGTARDHLERIERTENAGDDGGKPVETGYR